jgi:2-dehydropantoate 2-reductase
MKFAIVGAGAIGTYLGAALARGGTEVVLIARGDHLLAMQQRGVQVLSDRGDFHSWVSATDDLDAIGDADFVFLGLKAYSLPTMAPTIAERMLPGATVIGAQNGIPWWYFQNHGGPFEDLTLASVDPGGVVARAFPKKAVVGCVVYCSTEIQEPGVIRHVEGTRFTIGEPDGALSERCSKIAEAVSGGGLKCQVSDHLREHIWLKLVGNASFNPLSTITGATMHELAEVSEIQELLRTMMLEAASVAAALGIELPVSIEHRLERAFAVGDHKTSMLQDFESGKPLEYECMTGAIVELAELLKISVPSLSAVHACIKFLDPARARVGSAA